jgi:Spy/CpxP family protein refolding chaperone
MCEAGRRVALLIKGGDGMNRSTFSQLCGALVIAAILAPSLVYSQPPGDGGQRGGPGGFSGPFGGGGGLLGLVMRDEVQQEIQLVDEQRDKVMKVAEESREKMRAEMRDMFEQMRDLSDEERRERFGEIRSKMEEMNAGVETQLKKALLPHQLQRLKQIDLQVRMQQRGEGGLSSRTVAEVLELSDEQREKLEQRAEEVRQELQEKVRQAQSEAREKLLDVLTPEQKAKLEEMMGDAFQLQGDDRGGFRGREGRGRDGERGGDRGRERRGSDEDAT